MKGNIYESNYLYHTNRQYRAICKAVGARNRASGVYPCRSKKSGFANILKEMFLFIAGRVLSGVGDMIILYIFVDLLKLGNLPGKIASQIFVVIFNYVFSKLIIFRTGRHKEGSGE